MKKRRGCLPVRWDIESISAFLTSLTISSNIAAAVSFTYRYVVQAATLILNSIAFAPKPVD